VITQSSADKYSVAETVTTQKSARTMALDSKTHDIYTVAAKFGPKPAPTPQNLRGYPPVLPDTFVVLKLSRQ